jgi:hypothetical protein
VVLGVTSATAVGAYLHVHVGTDKTNLVQSTGALLVGMASACSCGVRMSPPR